MSAAAVSVSALKWTNTPLREELPIEVPEDSTKPRTPIPGVLFSQVRPTPVEEPELIAVSVDALKLLDLDEKECGDSKEFLDVVSGNAVANGTQPLAHNYCGHQFGHFSGQLGDGRAIFLGEVMNASGERWELQLKGAGRTPYSRTADGRAVLRSTIREFLCSEAMHHLGVPTTRAASIVTSATKVVRDIRYNGNPILEKATVLLRMSPTFLRFGSFELFKDTDDVTGRRGPSPNDTKLLKTLVDYMLKYNYPEIVEKFESDEDRYVAFLREIVERTAKLVAKWQCCGFCHGVLNTDNMSVAGVTIDYGPFGFMDAFDPGFVCNASDNGARYSYENQPSMCGWNLSKLGEALAPLAPRERLVDELNRYRGLFQEAHHELMLKKLGIDPASGVPSDKSLVADLLLVMERSGADFTNTFRNLNKLELFEDEALSEKNAEEVLKVILDQTAPPEVLAKIFKPQIPEHHLIHMKMVAASNPMMLAMMGQSEEEVDTQLAMLQKHKDMLAISADEKRNRDEQLWRLWLQRYRNRLIGVYPLVEDAATFSAEAESESKAPEEPPKPELSTSEPKPQSELNQLNSARIQSMNAHNPKFILRNYIAQRAIEQAEAGNYDEFQRVFKLLKRPFDEQEEMQEYQYDQLPPDWSHDVVVT